MILFWVFGILAVSAILSIIVGLPMVFFIYLLVIATALIFFSDKVFASISNLSMMISMMTSQTFRSYGDLETVMDEHTLVRRDSSLVSVLNLKGAREIIGNPEYNRMILRMQSLMKDQMMKTPGLDVQFIFTQSPGDSMQVAQDVLRPFYATAERTDLDLKDVLDSEMEVISSKSVKEEVLVVINTHLAALGEGAKVAITEHKENVIEKAKELLDLGGDYTSCQNPMILVQKLHGVHQGFVDSVMQALKECSLSVDLIPAEKFLVILKHEINRNSPMTWRPVLPGSNATREIGRPQVSYPALWRQLFDDDAEELPGGHVMINGMYYASVIAELPPSYDGSQDFNKFLSRTRNIPMRASFRIYSKGLDMKKFDRMMVGMLSLFPKSYNRRILSAMEDLESMELKDDPTMAVSIVMTTWAETRKELERNQQTLLSNLQGWGGFDASAKTGDAIELFASSLPAYSSSSGGKLMLMEASLVASLLPTCRPVSVWDTGAVLLTSLDGKLLPFQPGSSKQNFWGNAFVAPPGSGKSVLLLTIELAQCLAPGLSRLPLIAHIDVGESVLGLISLLQSALPDHRKGEAGYFKMKLTPEYSVNVFDTRLGLKYPLPIERDFLRVFLGLVCTPAGQIKPYDSVYELMGMAIDEIYKIKASPSGANKYEKGVNDIVDRAIDDRSIRIDLHSTWHEVVDELFKVGLVTEAEIANRYAAPLLSDIAFVLNSAAVRDTYGKVAVAGSNETLIEFCSRMISSVCRDYSIFSKPTCWNLRNCRVVGIDLNDVRGQGETGVKQTALMYMFAHNAATRNFYVHKDDLKNTPELYLEHWQRQVDDVAAEIKTITYDELHNATVTNPITNKKVGIDSLWRVLEQNLREGRKWGIAVNLASQSIDDFEGLSKIMSGFFIMNAGSAINQRLIQETLGLSETAMSLLDMHVKSPGRFMAVLETKDGTCTQIYRNFLSPIKTWAFSTTAEDKALKGFLYDRMPPSEARRYLSQRFPSSGDFKTYVEDLRVEMGTNNTPENGEDGNLIRRIGNEILAKWRTEKEQSKRRSSDY